MNGLSNDRKGQAQLNISSLGMIAITILIAVVILGLGATILEKIQGTQADSSATILNNESWAWPGNNTLQSFVQNRVILGSVVVYCDVSKFTLDENYTVGVEGVNIINLTTGGTDFLESCIFNMTYTYNFGSVARNSSGFGIVGVVTFAEFIPTIAIISAAAIVIGILLLFFGRRSGKEE